MFHYVRCFNSQDIIDSKKTEEKKDTLDTRKRRKKREWLEKKKRLTSVLQDRPPKKYVGSWANLPDLILEQIFQYLPYKVSYLN